MMKVLHRLWTDESGQDLVEYALLLVLLSLIVISALTLLGPTIAGFYNNVGSNLENAV